jgi:hypothetical protein
MFAQDLLGDLPCPISNKNYSVKMWRLFLFLFQCAVALTSSGKDMLPSATTMVGTADLDSGGCCSCATGVAIIIVS